MRDDLLYGIHVIEQLLKSHPNQILEIWVTELREDKRILEIQTLAREQGISLKKIAKKQLDNELPEANHQGIAARVRLRDCLGEHDLLDILHKSTTPPFLLVLDSIQDPHNLGACLRTADAVGVTAVIIPKDKSVALTPTVRKVASGAAETMPVVQVTNLARCLKELKEQGIWIMGTSLTEASQSLYSVDLKGPIAIVLGAEGTGLRRLTAEHCDILMHIPMMGAVASLNVAVAAGVSLYEALRQRHGKFPKK